MITQIYFCSLFIILISCSNFEQANSCLFLSQAPEEGTNNYDPERTVIITSDTMGWVNPNLNMVLGEGVFWMGGGYKNFTDHHKLNLPLREDIGLNKPLLNLDAREKEYTDHQQGYFLLEPRIISNKVECKVNTECTVIADKPMTLITKSNVYKFNDTEAYSELHDASIINPLDDLVLSWVRDIGVSYTPYEFTFKGPGVAYVEFKPIVWRAAIIAHYPKVMNKRKRVYINNYPLLNAGGHLDGVFYLKLEDFSPEIQVFSAN